MGLIMLEVRNGICKTQYVVINLNSLYTLERLEINLFVHFPVVTTRL